MEGVLKSGSPPEFLSTHPLGREPQSKRLEQIMPKALLAYERSKD